jgi:glutamate/tyrosine decarboxylase-like PLP-dependent enzyme
MQHQNRQEKTAVEDLSLSMAPETIRELGYRIVDMIVDEFDDPTRRPVFPPDQTRDAMEAAFGGDLPREGMAPEALLKVVQDELLPTAGNPNHPGLMAYVLTASAPLSALMEALVATIKLRPTTWKNQPASCHIEATVVRWLGQMVGFDDHAAGYLTTGGSWANLVGLAVARVRKAGWDIRQEGVADHPQLVAYVSSEAHSCLERSAEMLGIGHAYLRKIPVDADFRVRTDVLEDAIRTDLDAGRQPFCLIGNGGTVNTGAVDPLDTLADLADQYDMWFHVDGAYGAFATLAPETQPLFAGIERADSLTLDPHKWLSTPFEAGCILTKSWDDLGDTFSLVPPYLRGAMGAEHNQYEYGFELSRTDRALKVWLALNQYGVDRYSDLVTHHLSLARHLAGLVTEADDFEMVSEPVLSICCFRFVPPDLTAGDDATEAYLNELNHDIEMALVSDGRALVSGTELRGARVLRACIASHPVTQESVEEAFTLLQTFGHELHTERSAPG